MAEFTNKPKKSPDEFIQGATVGGNQTEGRYPWDDCNPQIQKYFNLRINEVVLAKLRFITENRPGSMQKWVRSVVEDAIEKEIKSILQKL
jgi:hypothetical protein